MLRLFRKNHDRKRQERSKPRDAAIMLPRAYVIVRTDSGEAVAKARVSNLSKSHVTSVGDSLVGHIHANWNRYFPKLDCQPKSVHVDYDNVRKARENEVKELRECLLHLERGPIRPPTPIYEAKAMIQELSTW